MAGAAGTLSVMFEICMDDDHGHVLAVHGTAVDALDALDRIADDTAAQLVSNGEGHFVFRLHLLVRDVAVGEVVVRSEIAG